MRHYLLTLSFFVVFSVFGQSQSEIGNALETGNSDQISNFFKENIDLEIPKSKGVYNKKQASIIVKNFFAEVNPNKYIMKHQGGGNDKALFEIGTLITSKNRYRTYLLYNLVEKTPQIIELRIQLEE